jgi:hypothetical protein
VVFCPAESGWPVPRPKKSNSSRVFRSNSPAGTDARRPSRVWRTLKMASPSGPKPPSTVGIRVARSTAFQAGSTRLKSWM